MSTTGVNLEELPLEELRRLAVEANMASDVPESSDKLIAVPVPAVPAVETPAEVPPAAPKRFRREIDLGDGSGIQKFEGATLDELVDNLAEAQRNATKKIREQAAQLKAHEPKGKTPSAEERLAVIEARIAWQQTAADFVAANPTYENTIQNSVRMERYMAAQGIPKTLEGLNQAFNELSESGLLNGKNAPAQVDQQTTDQQRIAAPADGKPTSPKVSSGLSARTGSLAQRAAKEELTVSDLSKLSDEELRKQTKAYFES